MSEVSDQWCRTTNDETTKTTFTWTIEDFKSRPEKVGEKITSSYFLANDPNEKTSIWQLVLYPKGLQRTESEGEAGNNVSIYLKNLNDFPINAKYSVSILDSSSKKTNTLECQFHLFERNPKCWGWKTWALRQPIITDISFLPGGHLTIFCTLTVNGTDQTLSGSRDVEIKRGTNTRGLEQVSEHLGKIFNDKEFSDVEVECDGETFNCHQVILSTRSDVFRAMFQADMTENRTNKVNIKDINSEVVKEMLHFIYTGSLNDNVLKEKSRELLEAAERYQLDVLKSICEDHLCTSLQINNAVENLVFGDLHQASKLRRMAMKVIARNLVKIVTTEEYQNLVKHHPPLAADIPMALVEDKMIT